MLKLEDFDLGTIEFLNWGKDLKLEIISPYGGKILGYLTFLDVRKFKYIHNEEDGISGVWVDILTIEKLPQSMVDTLDYQFINGFGDFSDDPLYVKLISGTIQMEIICKRVEDENALLKKSA